MIHLHNNDLILCFVLLTWLINRLNEAINNYSKAILINPNFAEAYYNRGTIQKDLNLYEDSYKSYNQAIKLKPKLEKE